MKTHLLLALLSAAAFAHEGPEHEIEELTERMKKHGESAELLTERAAEYRVLGKLAEATKDLERAVMLDPESVATHRELGRVLLLGGKHDDALLVVARALKLPAEDVVETASLRILRAEIHFAKKDDKKALEECDAGLKLHRQNPEWYLLRSEIQRRLKAHKERIAGLEEGIAQTGAGVLEIERVEAMMDAGKFADALKTIEAELADSRIKSSWLIRRARAFLGTGKKAEAERDLNVALDEIAGRLNVKMPDGPLLLDKALALELLDEKREALKAYEAAKTAGASGTVDERIKALRDATGEREPTGSSEAKSENSESK